MSKIRVLLGLVAVLPLPAGVIVGAATSAAAAVPAVTLVSDSANLSTRQVVDVAHSADGDATSRQFLTFARHVEPAATTTPTGTASAVATQTTTLSAGAAMPLPLHPLDDIDVAGAATTATTADASSAVVPSAASTGNFTVGFSTSGAVPVSFSGRIRTTNADANDSCSVAIVDLTGPVKRSFVASTGNVCATASPDQTRWALTTTLPAGDYSLTVGYSSTLDDNADDKEATSLTAAAEVSTDLSFFPPTASFTTTLAGFRGDFDGSRSVPGLAARPLMSWRWNFGDGRTAVTTTPHVSHVFARSPHPAPSYVVTLQVVDAGRAKSAIRTHVVAGTATTMTTGRTSSRLNVSGAVSPSRAGRLVAVALARRHSGSFHVLVARRLTLSARSRFATSFTRPASGTCRLSAEYAGDAGHLASISQAVVRC